MLELHKDSSTAKAESFLIGNESFLSSLTVDQRAQIYAYQQQCNVGKCNTPKPGFFEIGEKKKGWLIWNSLKDMSQDEAGNQLVLNLHKLSPDWTNWDGFAEKGNQKMTNANDFLNGTESQGRAAILIQTQYRRSLLYKKEKSKNLSARRIQKFYREKSLRNSQRNSQRGAAVESNSHLNLQGVSEECNSARNILLTNTSLRYTKKQIFNELLEGIPVIKYRRLGKGKVQRYMWLDNSGMYLYVDRKFRKNDKLKKKSMCLSDISDTRKGAISFTFEKANVDNKDLCLSIIGTGRSFDLEFLNKETRDQVYEGFQSLIKELQTNTTMMSQRNWNLQESIYESELKIRYFIKQFRQLLLTGIQMMKHTRHGFVHQRCLWIDPNLKRLYIDKEKRVFSVGTEKGVNLDDISEIRVGLNTTVFSKYDNKHGPSKYFSIISSERTIDLEVIDATTRDVFLERFQHFMLFYHKHKNLDFDPEEERLKTLKPFSSERLLKIFEKSDMCFDQGLLMKENSIKKSDSVEETIPL